MTKTKSHGGRRKGAGAPSGNQNHPKGPEKKLVSARVTLPIYEAIEARAEAAGRTVSAEIETILQECTKVNTIFTVDKLSVDKVGEVFYVTRLVRDNGTHHVEHPNLDGHKHCGPVTEYGIAAVGRKFTDEVTAKAFVLALAESEAKARKEQGY